MSRPYEYLLVLCLLVVLFWQLISGKAIGVWWKPSITREKDPKAYWFVLATQSAIVVYILAIGTATWHFR